MKNKNLMIGLAVLAVVLISGGYYFLSAKKAPKQEMALQSQEEQVMTLTPNEIGLSLTAGALNRKVVMTVANTADISSLDYELSYTSKGSIPRGVIGNLDVKEKGKPITKEILLGTCSDVCHYDEGVKSVKLTLKVTKIDNKLYQVEKTLEL